MNESIYFNVDRLHAAIAARRAITFQYFDYDLQRKKVLRRGGQQYAVSPYGLIWNSDNYYLVAYDSANREMRHYRVDKMTGITVTDKPLEHRVNTPPLILPSMDKSILECTAGRR